MRSARFTWPEMNRHGVESSQAPATPVTALVPPGPVVTMCDAEIIGGLGVVLGGHGAGLLVRVADGFQRSRHCASEAFRCMAPPPVTRKTCFTPRSATKRDDVIGELDHVYADFAATHGGCPARIRSTNSRTAPLPPDARVTRSAQDRAAGRASAGAAASPASSMAGQVVHVVSHEADFVQIEARAAPQRRVTPRPCPCSLW